jgi:hypothetical protein
MDVTQSGAVHRVITWWRESNPGLAASPQDSTTVDTMSRPNATPHGGVIIYKQVIRNTIITQWAGRCGTLPAVD